MLMPSMRLAATLAGIALTMPAAAEANAAPSASSIYTPVPRSEARVVMLRGKNDPPPTTATATALKNPTGVAQTINAPLAVNRSSPLPHLQAPLSVHAAPEVKP